MIIKTVTTKIFLIAAMGTLLIGCGSNPTADMEPNEISQYLGYSSLTRAEDIPAPDTFDLEDVNSKTAVMVQPFGRRYLILFSHSCPEVGFGNSMKTTATGGRLDTQDSIIIDDVYCRISEIFVLQ